MPKETKKANDNDYGTFLKGLRLVSLALKSCAAELDRNAHWKVNQKWKKPSKDLAEGYSVSRIGEKFFELEGKFSVMSLSRIEKGSPK